MVETTPLHALLQPSFRTSVLPFALESTVLPGSTGGGRPLLAGLDSEPLRALHAMSKRPKGGAQPTPARLFAAEPDLLASPREIQEDGHDDDGATAAVLPRTIFAAAADDPPAVRRAAANVAPVALSLFSAATAAAPPAPPGAAAAPRSPLVSPRSVTLHVGRINAVKRQEAVRRRWALVRRNLWRLVRDERRRLGLPDRDEETGAPSGAWTVSLNDWKDRSVEAKLRTLPHLKPISEVEIRALCDHASITTLPRYAQVHKKGAPLLSCFVVLQGSLRLSGLREGAVAPGVATTSRKVVEGALCGGGAWLDKPALHTETATCLTPCVLLTIRASEARQDSRLRDLCTRLSTKLGDAWKIECLRHSVNLFPELPMFTMMELAPLFQPLLVPSGQVLIREREGEREGGDEADAEQQSVFILVQGAVRVHQARRDGTDGFKGLTHISDSSEAPYFGEQALYEDKDHKSSSSSSSGSGGGRRRAKARDVTVQASEHCFLLVLHAQHFGHFSALVPGFGKRAEATDDGEEAPGASSSAAAALPPSAAGALQALNRDDGAAPSAAAPLASWVASLGLPPAPEVATVPEAYRQSRRNLLKPVVPVNVRPVAGGFTGLLGKAAPGDGEIGGRPRLASARRTAASSQQKKGRM